MPDIIKCKDCKHFEQWRSFESEAKHGQLYSCGLLVISSPSPDDGCSKGERIMDQKNEALNIKEDPTNPDHYKSQTSLECIDAMKLMFGSAAVVNFCLCNAYKYIWRHKNKNGVEDLEKARWYINRAAGMLCDYYGDPVDSTEFDQIHRMDEYIKSKLIGGKDG